MPHTQKRDFWCLPLKTHTDEVFKVTYVKVIGDEVVESLKIPTSLDKFKSRHILNPQHLIHVEVIKTRKNWIIKNVLSYKKILELPTYNDYLIQAALVNIILKHIHEDEPTDLLQFLVQKFNSQKISEIDQTQFESEVMSHLGYK